MKFLVLTFSLLCASIAQASLITVTSDQDSYSSGDTVIVEIGVENMNPSIDFIELDVNFDLAELAFENDSWFDSNTVLDFGAFGDAFLGLTDDNLIVQVSFLDGIVDFAGNTFALGELAFTAQSDINNVNLGFGDVFAQDFEFNPIDADDLQVQVPSPATAAFLLSGFALMMLKRRA